MVKFTTVSGRREPNTAMVFGRELLVTHTSANGLIIKLRDMECMYGKTMISMKVNGLKI